MNTSQLILALRGYINHAAADQLRCSYRCNIPEGEGSLDSSPTTLFSISSAVCRKKILAHAKQKLQCGCRYQILKEQCTLSKGSTQLYSIAHAVFDIQK